MIHRLGLLPVGVALSAVLMVGCTSASPTDAPAADPSLSSSSALDADVDSTVVIGGETLPANWPSALPAFPDGALVSAALSEQATQINAVWHSAADVATSWDAMDAALRAAGYVTTGELDGVDNLIDDEAMRSDVYRSDGYEVSISILAGDPVTVLLNASAL